jgi:tRNA A-37 threonylcarbamoyl transferase component Bud32
MHAIHASHPAKDELDAYAQGRLERQASLAVEEHLANCSTCLSAVEAAPNDRFVQMVRAIGVVRSEDTAIDISRSANAGSNAPPLELANHPRYRVLDCIGSGGMGTVFKAEHLLMKRVVALKVINPRLVDKPATSDRFRREVEAAARLSHPNIVTAFDAEQVDNMHFLIMEYVDGQSLDKLLEKSGRLPVLEACGYVCQAALGLQHAHECGMVHRDIKPQNLVVTKEGTVKILDFGLARLALEAGPTGGVGPFHGDATALLQRGTDTPRPSLTEAGTIMGTPDYIAPEQARDPHSADIRADIYSLGCTLYQLLAGRPPFQADTPTAKVQAHEERIPESLDTLGLHVPAALAKVVQKMLAKDPAQRYQTPAEVWAALAPFAPNPPQSAGATFLALGSLGLATLVIAFLLYFFGGEPEVQAWPSVFLGVGMLLGVSILVLTLIWLKFKLYPPPPIVRTMKLRQEREQIWRLISDFANYASWRNELLNFHPKDYLTYPGAPQSWREAYKEGYAREFFVIDIENTAPAHLVLHFLVNLSSYNWDFDLAVIDGGTQVTITVKSNPFVWFSWWSPKKHLHDVEVYLQSLAAKFGETAEIKQV